MNLPEDETQSRTMTVNDKALKNAMFQDLMTVHCNAGDKKSGYF